MESEPRHDPYAGCEQCCGHELVRGVTIRELLDSDGPFPAGHAVLESPRGRAVLLAGEAMRPRLVVAG